ncbi:MAG: AAA domain-containing protein [Gemmatimonadota bacterium]
MNDSEDGAGPSLDHLLDGCRIALEAEMEAVRADLDARGLSSPLAGGGGRRVSPAGSPPVYEWSLPSGRYGIRVDDAVRVESERGRGLGTVVRYFGAQPSVRVRLNEWLGQHPGPALLTFDPTWILEALRSRLSEIDEDPDRFHPVTALRLLGREFPRVGRVEVPDTADPGLNESQRRALSRVLGSEVQLVWGPPGTGKTRLLGSAVAALAAGGRVLVVATTNVAVDEAAARVAACLGEDAIEANRVVRVGAEFSPTGDRRLGLEAAVERSERREPSRLSRSLLELEGTLLDGRARARSPDLSLAERQARLVGRARGAADAVLAQRAGRLAAEMGRATRAQLDGARVVLSTFASLAIRDELAAQRFNHLIVDEASAAPLPQVFHAACLADRSASAFGDFQQLPPVVLSRDARARRWLARDLFEESGVLGHGDGDGLPSATDGLCSMLDEQYRMRPPIRSLVSDFFYGGRLRDADAVSSADPPGAALVLLESGGLEPVVSRVDGSKENAAHVEAILQLLEVLGREGVGDVGVVTPYRAQTRSLWQAVRGRLGQVAPSGLEISTIHRFQGREKAVVILDTVDAPPGSSWFLNERRNADLPRLVNVALSRSRDLLILVGTTAGLRQTLPDDALLNRVMERVAEAGTTVDARRVFEIGPLLRRGQNHSNPLE